ncbi:MAG: hypothetical protein J7639_24795 [Paenibacillaceae bacterium]|nr:hypothetical protein [Paenibacillaceae bacterium]
MNVDTGELIRLKQETPVAGGFEPIPEHLRAAAEKKLGSRDSATVSLTSGGKLSKWAAQKRKEKKKAAKEARRRNR